ncbi:MAG: chromosomal replication initiator protein DnaA [Elusimicrobiaceae bacterium]|nr:chromosomal replication initiator protein DnaA [Elusimicrobiaceae bacterium]
MDNFQLDASLLPIFQEVEQIIGKETYDLWFKTAGFTLNVNTLTVTIPNVTWGQTLKSRYEQIITDAFLKHTGMTIQVIYNVDTTPAAVTPSISSAQDVLSSVPTETFIPAVNPFSARFNPNYTFDNFIESPSNRFAYKAAQAVVHKLGARENNPLVIYSAPGLGKTHLLQAIGNQILKEKPQSKVMYMSGEEFVNEYIESMHQKTGDAFRKKYRFLDCFLVDDIQFVVGKQYSSEAFFYTFNTLFESGKQIVLSSDRSPQQLEWDERLSSRLLSGISTEIKRPNVEARIAILRQKRDSMNFIIGDDVVTFLAEGVQTNIRELEGALIRLRAYCTTHGVTPTIPIARELLGDLLVSEQDKTVSVNIIKKVVGKHFNIRMEDFSAKRKTQSIAWPRQIAMYLSTELTDLSLPEIGREFNRDHSTVVHARDLIKEKINTDPFFTAEINQIITDIKAVEKL